MLKATAKVFPSKFSIRYSIFDIGIAILLREEMMKTFAESDAQRLPLGRGS